jgi:hypothetical protein
VHRDSLVIGDFGGTFYFGKDAALHEHIARCEQIVQEVVLVIHQGMSFGEIYKIAHDIFHRHGMSNQPSESQTDPTGGNLGHTVPFFRSGENVGVESSVDISKLISHARQFISKGSSVRVPGCFVFEAQLRDNKAPELPMVLVHRIVKMDGAQAI